MKKCKNVFLILACTITIVILGLCVFSIFTLDDFFKITAFQALSLLIAIWIAFVANQKMSDKRKLKEHAENILIKIQCIAEDELVSVAKITAGNVDATRQFSMLARKMSNCISAMKTYGDKLDFAKDADYIETEFKRYREFVSEHISDSVYLMKSDSTFQMHAENISSKCESIISKLYQ